MRGISICSLALLGCVTETGVLLVIDANPQLPRPTEIVVMVGSPGGEIQHVDGDTFVDLKSDRFEVGPDRDLAKDPLRYLIRPDAGESIKIAVAGLGPELGEPLTAQYADTLEMVPDVVLELALTLDQRPGESFDECGRCFRADGPPFQITSQFDSDCDGSRPSRAEPGECADRQAFEPDDCDDLDARINPYALETCDGADNDCDERAEDYGVACFVDDIDTCLMGTSVCSEGNGFSDCQTEGDASLVPLDLCQTLGDCQLSEDPVPCFADKLRELQRLDERTCDIEIAATADGEARLCSAGPLLGFEPLCGEVLVAGIEGPPETRLSLALDGNAGLVVGQRIGCQEPVAITLGGERTLARAARLLLLELPLEKGPAIGHLIHLRPKYVESCGAVEKPLECF